MTKKPKIQAGNKAIQAIFADSKLELEAQAAIADPDPNELRVFDGVSIAPGKWEGAPWDRMPPGCPVKILGKKGDAVYAVSATGDLMEITKWDAPTMAMLFAPYINYMLWAWPAFSKAKEDPVTGELIKPRVDRLAKDRCVQCLIAEAGRRGIFDPAEQRRGRGGWLTHDNRMIWHSGKHLWMSEINSQTGESKLMRANPSEYDGFFYAQDSGILMPWQAQVTTEDTPAHQVLADLTSWNWDRAWLDPVLYLGWFATALMGAALTERPIIFVTGGHGRGKSTLHDFTKALLGATLISSANTSAAGIYQKLRYDSRPVMVDEFEAKARGEKEQAIIEIARIAYSGQNLDRGEASANGGVSFTLRCAFGFSAIIPPPMTVQDRSRMAILNLKKLSPNSTEPVIKVEWGRMMLRQVLDGWQRYQEEILPRWYRLLHRAGFNARARETYGGLLAAAELLVGETGLLVHGFPDKAGDGRIDEERLIEWIQASTRSEFIAQEEKWETVMDKLLSAPINNWKAGEKPTVGSVLEMYEQGLSSRGGDTIIDLSEARHRLALAGLWMFKAGDKTEGYCLAVPRSHDALDPIFAGTEYRSGGWYHALKQAPEEIVPPRFMDHTVKMGKLAKYCLLVDMTAYDKRRGEA
jgi:hypothetical protein